MGHSTGFALSKPKGLRSIIQKKTSPLPLPKVPRKIAPRLGECRIGRDLRRAPRGAFTAQRRPGACEAGRHEIS